MVDIPIDDESLDSRIKNVIKAGVDEDEEDVEISVPPSENPSQDDEN